MKEIKATVDVQNGGMRLDAFWQGILESEGVARTRVQSWIRAGRAQVDGRECRKPSLKLVPGQRLSLEPEEILSGLEPVSGDLDVVFADEHMLVINKTANLIVHPAPSVDEPTLVHHLAHAFPTLLAQGGERPGVVHRLDKDTTGLICVALSDPARLALTRAFSNRDVYKEYLALVSGVPPEQGRISLPLGRHPSIKTRMAVVSGGRPAETEYRLVWTAPDKSASLVRVLLHTGRTHQIRVHLTAIGHPLLGDSVYADPVTAARAPRQMLHAWQLRLSHPVSGQDLAFHIPPPDDFLERLRGLCRVPLRVGLTGVTGSGKSTVRRVLEEEGVPVFCADQAVARSYEPGGDGWKILRHYFGSRFVPDEGQGVDKAALYAAMRDSDSLRREIEGLIHPVVRQALHAFQKAQAGAVSVAEIPLLCEAGLTGDVDLLAVVFCPREQRETRLAGRGWSAERVASVDSWQWRQTRKLREAQLVVDNSGSLDDLTRRACGLARVLRDLEAHRAQRHLTSLTSFLTEPSTF